MSQNATTERIRSTQGTARPQHSVAYSVLIGLAALAVLLQGLWAGIFLEHDGKRDDASSWIDVHARGADIAIGLTVIALVVAVVTMRSRKDLVIGTAALAVLLLAESYLGGLIVDASKDTLTAVHVPLAMAIMGLAVWLPLRSRVGRRGAAGIDHRPDRDLGPAGQV